MEQKRSAQATCFVIMPFGGSDKGERFRSKLVYEHVIRPAFEEAKRQYSAALPASNVNALRIDEAFVDDLKEGIVKNLHEALIVVADVSGNNANVLFEVGFRHALGKPLVCISHKPEDVAFWASKFQVIDYTDPSSRDLIVAGILHGFQRVRTNTDLALESLLLVLVKDGPGDSLQDRAAAWRLQVVKDQIKSIQAGEWTCDFKSNPSYMHHLLEGAAALLQKGEKYRSLTNASFWRPEVDSILTANVASAKKKGVLIERVFVLTKDELDEAKKNPEGRLRRVLDAQIEAARDVVQATQNEQSFVVKAHIIDTARGQKEYGNFALLYEAGGIPSLALEPKTGSEGEFVELRFYFLRGVKEDRKVSRWVDRLERAFDKGKPLDDLLPITKSKRVPARHRKATGSGR